jgi:hypothetical protein
VGLAAFVLVVVVTSRAPGYGPDAAAYLGIAQNIRAGRGPTVPFDNVADRYSPRQVVGFDGAVPSSGFPPLYPATVAAAAAVTRSSVDQGGRWLGALVAAVNAVLFAAVVRRCLRRRSWALAATAAALLTATVWWTLAQASLLSEASFVAWMLAAVLVVPGLLTAPTRRRLAVAGVVGAAAVLTRWVGLSVPLALGLACVLNRAWSGPDRLKRAAAVAVPGAAAAAAWWLYGSISAGHTGPAVIAFHLPSGVLASASDVISAWLFGPDLSRALAVVLTLILILILAIGSLVSDPDHRRRSEGREAATVRWSIRADSVRGTTLRFLALFSVLYAAVVYGTRIFLDVTLPITATGNFLGLFAASRVYLPLLPILVCVMFVAAETIGAAVASRVGGSRRFEALVAGSIVAVFLGGGMLAAWVNGDVENSLPRPAFERSPLYLAVRSVDPATLLASPRPDLVWLGARRPVVKFPAPDVWLTGERNPSYEADVVDLDQLLCQRGGIVVIPESRPLASIVLAALRRHARIRRLATYADGSLYVVTGLKGVFAFCRRAPRPALR